jgi:SAM-dependent methyltransferase
MCAMAEQTDEADPPDVICRRFLTTDVLSGNLILDVGCGYGGLMTQLTDLGGKVVGIEIDRNLVNHCRGLGFDVREGRAEKVPFQDDSFDRIVCSVVVPYTDERKAVGEWERLIKPGGRIFATYHGLGYGLKYAFMGATFKKRVYGGRMLTNTYWYWITGRRLPGLLGDTLCQGRNRLRSYYRALGLVLEQELIEGTVAGLPLFICHRLAKPHSANDIRGDGVAHTRSCV